MENKLQLRLAKEQDLINQLQEFTSGPLPIPLIMYMEGEEKKEEELIHQSMEGVEANIGLDHDPEVIIGRDQIAEGK